MLTVISIMVLIPSSNGLGLNHMEQVLTPMLKSFKDQDEKCTILSPQVTFYDGYQSMVYSNEYSLNMEISYLITMEIPCIVLLLIDGNFRNSTFSYTESKPLG